METPEQRTEAFMKDLKDLLKKYDAEICVEEINQRSYRGGDWVMGVVLNGVYGKDSEGYSECLKAYTEIDLGNFITGKD